MGDGDSGQTLQVASDTSSGISKSWNTQEHISEIGGQGEIHYVYWEEGASFVKHSVW